jgi:hypothetical protein
MTYLHVKDSGIEAKFFAMDALPQRMTRAGLLD